MTHDKMSRLQNAVVELAGWSGNDIAGLIEDGLIEDGDLEAAAILTPPVAGEPEREALAWLIIESEWWAVKASRLADDILAAGYRREPEPREVTTEAEARLLRELIEEFPRHGLLSFKGVLTSRLAAVTPSAERGES